MLEASRGIAKSVGVRSLAVIGLMVGVLLGAVSTELNLPIGQGVLAATLLLAVLLVPLAYVPCVIIGWLSVQNVILPTLFSSGILTASTAREFLVVGELMVALVIIRALKECGYSGYSIKWTVADRYLAIYCMLVALYILLPGAGGIVTKGLAARGLWIPALYYLLGKTVYREPRSLAYTIVAVVVMSVVSSGFGWVVLLWDRSFWTVNDIGLYWVLVKGNPVRYLIGALPGNFYRIYNGTIGSVLRFVSLAGDPLASAYQLIGPAVIGIWAYAQNRQWRLYVLLGAAVVLPALVFGWTRASWGAVVLGWATFLFVTGYRKAGLWLGVIALAFLTIAMVSHGSLLTLSTGSGRGHVLALLDDLRYVPQHIFGTGLGTTGGVPAGLPSGENALFFIYGQIGLLPSILFVAFLVSNAKILWDRRDTVFGGLGLGLLAAYIFTGLVSTELFTDTATGLFWILLGQLMANHAPEKRMV